MTDNTEEESQKFLFFLQRSIEMAHSERIEDRLKSIKVLLNLVNTQFFPDILCDNMNNLTLIIQHCILEAENRNEHDNAIFLECSFSLSTFLQFECYANTILNEMLSQIYTLRNNQSLRFFGIGFISAFSLSRNDQKADITNRLISILTSHHTNQSNYSSDATAEIIRSISILISSQPPQYVKENLPLLETFISIVLESRKVSAIASVLELFSIIFESLLMYPFPKPDSIPSDAVEHPADTFAQKFLDQFNHLEDIGTTKNEKTILKKAIRIAIETSERKKAQEIFAVLEQKVHIEGRRKLCLMSAIKRVTQSNFQTVLGINENIQDYFNYTVLSVQKARREKKRNKEQIKSDRVQTSKGKKQNISKMRKQKDDRLNDPF